MKPSLWSVWFAGWPCASLCTRHSTHPKCPPYEALSGCREWLLESPSERQFATEFRGVRSCEHEPAAADQGHGAQGSGPVSTSPAAADRGHGGQGSGPVSTSPLLLTGVTGLRGQVL